MSVFLFFFKGRCDGAGGDLFYFPNFLILLKPFNPEQLYFVLLYRGFNFAIGICSVSKRRNLTVSL